MTMSRTFWIAFRRALLMMASAIKKELESPPKKKD